MATNLITHDPPIPQADDLEKVFRTVDLVAAGATTHIDIAEALGVVPRQGFFYAAASGAFKQ